MSDKGVGEATQREFHVHFPLLCWVQGNPQTLYLQSPIISHQKIKEDFLGRVPKIPVDQPLEGNITQIHHDSTKAHPKCTRRSWGGENTQGKPFPLEARREELRFYLQTRLIISSDVRNEEEPRKQSWFLCFFSPVLSCGFLRLCLVWNANEDFMKMFISQVAVAAITGKRKEAVEEQLDRQMGCWRDERMFADQETERF